ncbi:MAG TPA: Tad domain-containing protein [Gammaproteobacteria bacterium]|nr:Tad domain-containing protein [Gammaproteobacteria bacterium]
MPRKPLASRKQRGQALIFITVMLAVVLLSLVTMYSVGQLATSKMKLQNTADAAAYSGALTEARDYNFSAYANRAMVANQVAVSQIVGLTSWARNYNNSFNGEFSAIPRIFAKLSPLGAMWSVPFKVLGKVAKSFQNVMDKVAPLMVKGLDYLIDALSDGSYAYHLATVVNLVQTVNDVVKANDPDAEVSLSPAEVAFAALHAADWYKFTKRFDPTLTGTTGSADSAQGGSSDRFANVTQFASNDEFAKFRSYPWITPSLLDPTRLIPYNEGTMLMLAYHSGGTELKTGGNLNKKAWTALDATGLFVIVMIWIPVFGVPVPIPIPLILPMGHGAAQAYSGSSANLQPQNNFNHNAAEAYGGAYVNPFTAVPAAIQLAEGPGKGLDTNAGLKKYMDVSDRKSGSGHEDFDAPGLVIEVKKDSSKIPTSNQAPLNVGTGGGDLYLPDDAEQNQLRALSKAGAYFSRPTDLWGRSDGKTEYGSLYNPYWQVHLLPNNVIEQASSILGEQLW